MRAIFIILLSIVFTACGINQTRPIPQSVQADMLNEEWAVEWWLPRHEQKLMDKTQEPVELIFIGDSITHGWEAEGQMVWRALYEERNGFNLGFGGDRTENVLWRLENGAVDGLSPKLIVLMIGTNNTGHRIDAPEDTVAGINKIIDTLKTKLPNTEVLHLAIFPRGPNPSDPMRIRNAEINALLTRRKPTDRVSFLNINNVFLRDDGTLDTAIMPDLLHLTRRLCALG